MANVAVIYYSSTGNVHALAEAIAKGAGSRHRRDRRAAWSPRAGPAAARGRQVTQVSRKGAER